MHWRAGIMLMVGIGFMYAISLLSEPPYPRPQLIHKSAPAKIDPEPTEMLLSIVDGYFYQTFVWYEIDQQQTKRGVGPLKTGAVGVLQQRRRPLHTLVGNATDDDWETMFHQELSGPISSLSRLSDPSTAFQFGVLYHTLTEEHAHHDVRLFYMADNQMTYKDIRLPGSTWISTFSLGKNALLYKREPDQYGFRALRLPSRLEQAPHTIQIDLSGSSTSGAPFYGHQPRLTETHAAILTQIYAKDSEVLRAVTLDVHKTPRYFHINVTLVDGSLDVTEPWKVRNTGYYPEKVYTQESLQYMTFVDGTHFRQERVESSMPRLDITKSANGKTLVMPYIRNKFLTLDYTSQVDAIKEDDNERRFLYKESDGSLAGDYYFWNEDLVPVESPSTASIEGLALNDEGNVLAVWIEEDNNYPHIYIYERDKEPHDRVAAAFWETEMVIPSGELAFSVSE
jgi:hypothetical protein